MIPVLGAQHLVPPNAIPPVVSLLCHKLYICYVKHSFPIDLTIMLSLLS